MADYEYICHFYLCIKKYKNPLIEEKSYSCILTLNML